MSLNDNNTHGSASEQDAKLIALWTEDMVADRIKRGFSGPPADMGYRIKNLLKFTEFVELDLQEIIDLGKAERRTLQKLILKWFGSLKEKKSHASASRMAMTSIMAFLREMMVPIKNPIPAGDETSQAEIDDAKSQLLNKEGLTQIVRHWCDNLQFTYRVLAVSLISTGADIGNILTLDVGFFRERAEGDYIYWLATRPKRGSPIKTYFSKEATAMIRMMLEQYHEESKDTDQFFIAPDGTPLNVPAVGMAFKRAGDKIGAKNGVTRHPFRPRRMRKIIMQAGNKAGVRTGYIKLMMGKRVPESIKEYLDTSPAGMLDEFMKLEPFLTVYGSKNANKASMEQIDALRRTLVAQAATIGTLENDMGTMRKTTGSLTRAMQSAMTVILEMSTELGKDFETLFKEHFAEFYKKPKE